MMENPGSCDNSEIIFFAIYCHLNTEVKVTSNFFFFFLKEGGGGSLFASLIQL